MANGSKPDFSKLLAKLAEVKAEGIYLVRTPSERHHAVNRAIVEHLTKRLNLAGVYVSFNESYASLVGGLAKEGIETDRLYFIDCASQSVAACGDALNCTATEGPSSLTELLVVLTTAMNTGQYKFVFVDSLSTMLMYNKVEEVEKFMHQLIRKDRNLHIQGTILSIEEEKADKLVPAIQQLCDKTIRV